MSRSNLQYSVENIDLGEGRKNRFRAALRAARRGAEAVRLLTSDDPLEVQAFLKNYQYLRGTKIKHTHIVLMSLVLRIGILALKFKNFDEAKKYSSTLQRSLPGFLGRRDQWSPRNHTTLYYRIQAFKEDVAREAKNNIIYRSEHLKVGRRQESLPPSGMENTTNANDLRLHEVWNQVLEAEGVKNELRTELIIKLRLEIARAIRPKWVDRLDHRELRTLTAPAFLKTVHAAEIKTDGRVPKELIRDIDPDLMKAVEMYVSQRNRRNGGDLGDAEGLTFIGERRPGSGRPKVPQLGQGRNF